MADYYVDINGNVTKKKKKANYSVDINGKVTKNITVEPTQSHGGGSRRRGEDDDKIFTKGAFDDGYQLFDGLKTAASTVGDIGLGVIKGAGKLVEGVGDLATHGIGYGADLVGAEKVGDFFHEIATDETVENTIGKVQDYVGSNSVLGEKGDMLPEVLGYAAGIYLTGGVGAAGGLGTAGTTALTTGTIFGSGMGSGISEAYQGGATDGEAAVYGLGKGAIEAGTELLFGGFGKWFKTKGFSSGIADKGIEKIANLLTKNTKLRNVVTTAINAGGEGLEEVLAGRWTAEAKKMTYMSEEDFDKILEDEKLLEQFVLGALAGGIMSTPSLVQANKQGVDLETGLTSNEQKVVDAEVQNRISEQEKTGDKKLTSKDKAAIKEQVMTDIKRGGISIDTIESVLGGETYNNYKTVTDKETSLNEQIKTLNNEISDLRKAPKTIEVEERYTEAKQELQALENELKEFNQTSNKAQIQAQLHQEVDNLTQNDRFIRESYNEKARVYQSLDIDLSKYDAKRQEAIKTLTEDVKLNNTKKTHEAVELLSKVAVDRNLKVKLVDKAFMQKQGEIEGVVKNAYITKDGEMFINIESSKYAETLAVHEVLHDMKNKTPEIYTELESAIIDFAKTKGIYDSRLKSIKETYFKLKGQEISEELAREEVAASLSEDYIATDEEFVRNLSVKQPNVFKRIYEELKYLWKIATAGSKEKRQLEKAKKLYDKVYRESANVNTTESVKNNTSNTSEVIESVEANTEEDINLSLTNKNINQNDNIPYVIHKKYKNVVVNDQKALSNLQNNVRKIKRGTYENKATGYKADINANTINKILNPTATFNPWDANYNYIENLNAAMYLPELFENAVYVDSKPPQKAKNKGKQILEYHHFVAPIEMNNGDYRVLITAREKINSNTLYVVKTEIFQKKRGASVVGQKPTNMIGAPRTITIADLVNGVKIYDYKSQQNKVYSDADIKYSLSEDTKGRTLTKEQQDFLVDSKVRDENGALKVMYHGTPNGDFTVFKDGTYFTENKEYADRYQSPSASSISSGKVASSPKTFEVYLNITKPFDLNDAEAREIYINDYIKGGNAIGINPYLSDAEYAKIDTIDWTEGEDLRDFLIDNGYDYDGLVLDEGADGGYGDEVNYRGKSYVIFNANQVKAVDNIAPTSSDDIRYSLSDDIKNTDDIEAKYKDKTDYLFLYEKDNTISIENMVVKKEFRNQGIGTQILNDVISYADKTGKTITLTPTSEFGTKEKLKKWYKANGFVENKGRNTDFLIRDTMYRLPQSNNVHYSLSEDSNGNELSPLVQKRFEKSKARDEYGNLKVLYHGTPSGEFTIFDKSKGSVEGDFGSGFYFTDNESDVELNYEGGGSDFENKVARRAEQIESEEDIDYDEAEARAREELYKGSHKFEVYLNIENPAIVGETILLSQDDYLENYDPDDFDDYDDYIAEVEQLVADDIENIVWEVENNVDVYNTDGLSGVLYEAYYEGGIGIEELKAKINELYLEDSEGNMAGNEVTRQIIESLGYDGIIDNTVSSKWNRMEIEDGTTHYIVFKPNQIKSITNENPTENPDINLSISNQNEDIAPTRSWGVRVKDMKLEETPVREVPTESVKTVQETDYAPLTAFDAFIRDTEQENPDFENYIPDEVEAPYYEPEGIKVDDPFYERDIKDVGDRKVKAYMYENPEVKPFFQQEAQAMLYELENSIKGEKQYNDQLYAESGGEKGWFGTKRTTSDDIAYLLDNFKYTYADIKKGLNAIIEDNGKENNAISKRIEFALNDRLKDGYTDFLSGYEVPANQDYINLLAEKQINTYSDEAYNEWVKSLADLPSQDIAPIRADITPVREVATVPYRNNKIASMHQNDLDVAIADDLAEIDKIREYEQIAEVLDETPVKESTRNKRIKAIIEANVLDKGLVFENLALKTKGKDGKYDRELEAKWNHTLYSDARAQEFIGSGAEGVKSLNDIIAEVENTDHKKDFYQYMYHKHNIDRMNLRGRYKDKNGNPMNNKPVFGDAVTSDVSKEIVEKYEQLYPEFKGFAQDVYDYMNHLRSLMLENGIITKETVDLWSEMYPNYVPINRVGENGLNVNVPLDTGRTGVNAPIKQATGGSSNILPLFDTMASRTLQTYKAIAKNSFGVSLKNALGSVVSDENADIDEVIDSIDSQDSLLQEGKNGKNPTFTVFENGKRVTFEVTKDMYDALKPLSESSILSKNIPVVGKFSNIRRGLITEFNPVFMLTNPIKDVQDVLINSQHPAQTYKKIPEAFAQIKNKGYWYNEYVKNGGSQNSFFDNETGTFKTENKGLSSLLDKAPLKWISQANQTIEMLPRLAEYIASREAGASVEVSMLDAARVTTNFRAGGDVTKFMNRNGFTFLNASVQGAMQQVRNVREAKANGMKGFVNLATKYAIAGLPVFLLNRLLWDDDEDYEELSDYVKQNYYVLWKGEYGEFVRIPKGRMLAVIQDGLVQMENLITGNDEVDMANFLKLVVDNIAPANPMDNNVIAPFVQATTNTTWYGEDLVPTRLQDLPNAEQYDESTDSFSKWLGGKTNISPVKINYLLDQYSGGIGDVFLPMMTPEAESGSDSFGEELIAPIRDKFTTDSTMNNQNVSDFYDMSDELTKNANSSKATDEDKLKSKYFNAMQSQVSELYKQKREIQNSKLSNSEKYNKVKEIQKDIVELTKEALKNYSNVSIDGNYAVVGGISFRYNNGEWTKISDSQSDTQAEAMSNYGISGSEYWSNKDEYSFAVKNPEKYELLNKNNVTYEEYSSNEDVKDAYNWAYNNPEKYAVSKVIADDVVKYKSYTSKLNNIKADKDKNGKTINGSRKEKVLDYIGELDIDNGARMILFKTEYPSDNTFNEDIVEYLNNRSDISYQEMKVILEELGFIVTSDGRVSW